MADLKISQLTGATTPLAGTEVAPIVQSGTTKQVSVADLTAGRAVSMGSGTVTGDLTVDTSTLKVDSTNNRVGVGTASPGRLLELYAAGSPVLRWNDSSNTWDIRTNGSVGSAMQFDYTGTRFFTLTSGGDFQVNTGNVVMGTSGKGIDFSATSGTGTSELLADYEEGTWTPIDASGGGLVLTVNYAKYVKIGRQVTVNAYVGYPANADANNATIGGLPFTVDSGSYVPAPILTNTGVSVGANLLATTATFLLVNPTNAASYVNSIFNGTYITVSATYFV